MGSFVPLMRSSHWILEEAVAKRCVLNSLIHNIHLDGKDCEDNPEEQKEELQGRQRLDKRNLSSKQEWNLRKCY